jgi:hypothetical protein
VIRTSLALLLLGSAFACGGPEPRTQQAMHSDGVPANSLAEKRLGGDDDKAKKEDDKKKVEEAQTDKADPTQPLMTPMSTGGDDPKGGAAPGPGGAPATKKTGKVTKAECGQLFDKYIELSIGADSRLEGIPPELIQQAKAQARGQKGDPCEKEVVPRSKYNCAMAAQTPAAWQKCMK